jgi:hypothetical protein
VRTFSSNWALAADDPFKLGSVGRQWLPRLPPTSVAGRADATTHSNGTDYPVTARSTA